MKAVETKGKTKKADQTEKVKRKAAEKVVKEKSKQADKAGKVRTTKEKSRQADKAEKARNAKEKSGKTDKAGKTDKTGKAVKHQKKSDSKEPRKLTTKEKNAILGRITIPHNHSSVNVNIHQSYIDYIRRALDDIKLLPQAIEKYTQLVLNNYYRAITAAGEPVGVLAAQSYGEPMTQATLNTFHLAGVGNKYTTGGLERILRLFAASANQREWTCSVHLKPEVTNNLSKVLQIMREELLPIKLRDIILSITTKEYVENEWWYRHKNTVQELKVEGEKLYYIDIQFNPEKLFYHKIDLRMVAKRIKNKNRLLEISPMTIDVPSIHVYIVNMGDDDKETMEYKASLKDQDIDSINHYIIRNCITPELCDVHIQGIDGIVDMDVSRKDGNGDEWMLYTLNGPFNSILTHPLVDFRYTVSTKIRDVYNVLGIEAARSLIVQEMNDIVRSSGSSIDPAHVELIADSMCSTGELLSISRYGMRQRETGVISQASFEQIIDTHTAAAVQARKDHIGGVSASVALGQPIQVGTGPVTLISIN